MAPTVSDETVAANPSPASASLRTESNMGQMQEYLQKKCEKYQNDVSLQPHP